MHTNNLSKIETAVSDRVTTVVEDNQLFKIRTIKTRVDTLALKNQRVAEKASLVARLAEIEADLSEVQDHIDVGVLNEEVKFDII